MASIRRSAMAVLLAILLSGCAGGKAAQSARETRYFRLASSQSENYVTNQACLRFCDAVRKRSGGSIIIEPYFDSTLGEDTQALEQCCFGGVDFAAFPQPARRSMHRSSPHCKCLMNTPRTSICSACWMAKSAAARSIRLKRPA